MASTLAAPAVAVRERLLSLDVLRGFTMAAMVMVNDPGSGANYAQLDHAEWHGATFTDMIFPSFLVMVGIAMTLSFAARLDRGADHGKLAWHAMRRGLIIVVIGLVLNGIFGFNPHTLRFAGVLQRIGICYLLGSLLYLAIPGPDLGRFRYRREIIIAAVAVLLLGAYWALLFLYPTPGFGPGHLDSYMSLPAYVDRQVLGKHIYRWGLTPGMGNTPTYDPEGVLSTLPAITNVLFGILAGEILRSPRSLRLRCGLLATMGTTLWLSGLGLSYWLPLNKKIWTSTFAMFTSGLAILCLAGLLVLIDLWKVRRGWGFFLIFGTNAILAYVLSDLLGWFIGLIKLPLHGQWINLHAWLMRGVLNPTLSPKMASLGYALLYVLAIAALVYPLYRRRIFLRI